MATAQTLATWRRTLTIGALAGVGVGIVLPAVLTAVGGVAALVLGEMRGHRLVADAVNAAAPVLLYLLDLPATLLNRAFPGHSDSALLMLALPPIAWMLAGIVAAGLVRMVVRR